MSGISRIAKRRREFQPAYRAVKRQIDAVRVASAQAPCPVRFSQEFGRIQRNGITMIVVHVFDNARFCIFELSNLLRIDKKVSGGNGLDASEAANIKGFLNLQTIESEIREAGIACCSTVARKKTGLRGFGVYSLQLAVQRHSAILKGIAILGGGVKQQRCASVISHVAGVACQFGKQKQGGDRTFRSPQ